MAPHRQSTERVCIWCGHDWACRGAVRVAGPAAAWHLAHDNAHRTRRYFTLCLSEAINMKPRITVITLTVSDLERAVRVYRDGLALTTTGIIGKEFNTVPLPSSICSLVSSLLCGHEKATSDKHAP